MKKLQVLLLCDRPSELSNAGTILDHISAFETYSRHNVTVLSSKGRLPRRLDLAPFDVIVVHYTLYLPAGTYVHSTAKARIRESSALKVVFIQDEYRYIHDMVGALDQIEADVIFTCIPESYVERVYPSDALPGTRKVQTLTGYVPERLIGRSVPRIEERPVDVGYRARELPYHLGKLAREKSEIADQFLMRTEGVNLVCDISCKEEDRIYGEDWLKFLGSCKATLGVESGASICDFTGEIERRVNAYMAAHPEATFDEVHSLFLEPYEGRIRMNQVSPRCFEAAALKTVMVLYEGEYSGMLEPWRHYVPLRKDFSNIDEVVEALKSPALLQEIADRTYEEIAANPAYSFAAFVREFDRVIEEECESRGRTGNGTCVSQDEIDLVRNITPWDIVFDCQRCASLFSRYLWGRMPEWLKSLLRPMVRLLR